VRERATYANRRDEAAEMLTVGTIPAAAMTFAPEASYTTACATTQATHPIRPSVGAAMGTVAYAGAGNVCDTHDGVFCMNGRRQAADTSH